MNWSKVKPGDKLRIPAAAWNTMLDMAADWKSGQLDGGRGSGTADSGRQFILVRNDSGSNVDRFGVLGVDAPVILPSSNLAEFQTRVVLSGVAPSADHAGRFVILQEPLADGAIGRAWVAGACPVQVNVSDEGHGFAEADVSGGNTGYLVSSESGSARILWKEEGTGTKWAVVRLGDTAGGAGSGGAVWSPTQAFMYPATSHIYNDGRWHDLLGRDYDRVAPNNPGGWKLRKGGTLVGLHVRASVVNKPGNPYYGKLQFRVIEMEYGDPLLDTELIDTYWEPYSVYSFLLYNTTEGSSELEAGTRLGLQFRAYMINGPDVFYLEALEATATIEVAWL